MTTFIKGPNGGSGFRFIFIAQIAVEGRKFEKSFYFKCFFTHIKIKYEISAIFWLVTDC